MFSSRGRPDARILPPQAGRWLWGTAGFDGMTLAWMLAAGSWLDSCSPCRVATLGGRHVLVMLLASVGLVMLVVLAPLTEGFTLATPQQVGALAVACMFSLIASSGILSLAILVGFIAFVLWLLGRH
jgi:hypothetical protein